MGQVRIERVQETATVTLSHPGRRNAIDENMWRELRRGFEALSMDHSLRCIVVRGDEGHFAGGADISEFPHLRADLDGLRRYHEELIAPALAAISDSLHPTVACIEGACVGGGLEIACRCDLRVAAHSARLGVPINRLGFPMAPAELAGLIAVAGRATALELLLEGQLLSADEAARRNLITHVHPDHELDDGLARCIANLVAGAPLAARINKHLVGRMAPLESGLDARDLARAWSYHDSHDHREGVSAFLEGRAPHFLGS